MSLLHQLHQNKLLTDIPIFAVEQLQYLVIMGSFAYGVSENQSDLDVYGFSMPPKDHIFPSYIPEFDSPPRVFQQFQQHGIVDSSCKSGSIQEYDVTVYSICKFFRLLSECNPNIINALFVPEHCVLWRTDIAHRVCEQRHLFLSKQCWQSYKGYAQTQRKKLNQKKPVGKRQHLVAEYGYDVKFAYHIVRLLNECEQLLLDGDLDLSRQADLLASIRQGSWSLHRVDEYIDQKLLKLDKIYRASLLPEYVDKAAVRGLLQECIEAFYGTMDFWHR